METKLIYLEHMDQYACDAKVVNVLSEDGRTVIILDQTVFYPQGGGQPYDTGVITGGHGAKFLVEEVRFVDGAVRHIGKFQSGTFAVGDTVTCAVDIDRRQLHSRLHSAGHVVDMGLKKLGIQWKAGKGYHFPVGSYDEYAGNLNGADTAKMRADLEAACNEVIAQHIPTKVLFMKWEDMASVCAFVPDHIPDNKPGRVVMYGDFGIPCGGTHVANLSEIKSMTIRKIKQDGPNVRVSYAVE
ncbi:MAG: hypothetical protein HY617_03345 [Candidatus Sungbacteria bacterium]|nr:hypothetical protein [Candidatus Sungbacteria bacterium]